MIVNVYYIRHGFSCSNARSMYHEELPGYLKEKLSMFRQDPPLTKFSILKTFESSKDMPIIDILCSSILLRAQQTAALSFSDLPIFVVPYVSEMPFESKGNNPSDFKRQQKFLGGLKKRVDYTFVKKNKSDERASEIYRKPNMEKFIIWLGDNLNKLLEKSGINKNKKIINIAVTTHSRFMNKYIDHYDVENSPYPYNNAVVLQSYKLDYVPRLFLRDCPFVKSFKHKNKNDKCEAVKFEGIKPPKKEEFSKYGGFNGCFKDPDVNLSEIVKKT